MFRNLFFAASFAGLSHGSRIAREDMKASIADLTEGEESDLQQGKKTTCPPPGYNAVDTLDVNDFISRFWYIQMSIPDTFGMECIRANYTITEERPQGSLLEIIVDNYALGAPNAGTLRASATNLSEPSKLVVGPPFVPVPFRGPYWVMALWGKPYERAIITGGPPMTVGEEGCTGSGAGFWLFSRKPVEEESVIEEMLQAAKDLGLDTSVLEKVQQEGCCGERYGVPCPDEK